MWVSESVNTTTLPDHPEAASAQTLATVANRGGIRRRCRLDHLIPRPSRRVLRNVPLARLMATNSQVRGQRAKPSPYFSAPS